MAGLVINGRFLGQSVTGVQRYGRELIRAIDQLLETDEYQALRKDIRIVTPADVEPRLELTHIALQKAGNLRGHAWEQIELTAIARGHWLLSCCNTAPLAHPRSIVTLHDTAVFTRPEAYSWRFRSWHRFMLTTLWRRAKEVITGSTDALNDFESILGRRARPPTVIHHGHDHMQRIVADQSVLDRFGLRGRSYALAVSSRNPNKNFARLLAAFELIDDPAFSLVVVGGKDDRIFAASHKLASKLVIETDFLTDGELKSLYQNTGCFVYPSLFEGFGLPPLEALSCGAKVLVADIAVLREVLGEAADYCDPLDTTSIARELVRSMSSPARDEVAAESVLKRLTWERSARQHLRLIFGTALKAT